MSAASCAAVSVSADAVFVGIDVSKARLDVAAPAAALTFSVANEEAGIAQLLERLQPLAPVLIVLEATGGLEVPCATALALAGLPVAVVNPRRARDFARATGQQAKTDPLDARGLAHFAQAVRPPVRALPDAQAQELSALLARRKQLVEMLTMEQNRRHSAPVCLHASLHKHIAYLQAELAQADDDLHTHLKSSAVWQADDDILQSVPGVGKTVSLTLLAELPELGRAWPPADRGLSRCRALQQRQRQAARTTQRVRRAGQSARGVVHGGSGCYAPQPADPPIL